MHVTILVSKMSKLEKWPFGVFPAIGCHVNETTNRLNSKFDNLKENHRNSIEMSWIATFPSNLALI